MINFIFKCKISVTKDFSKVFAKKKKKKRANENKLNVYIIVYNRHVKDEESIFKFSYKVDFY